MLLGGCPGSGAAVRDVGVALDAAAEAETPGDGPSADGPDAAADAPAAAGPPDAGVDTPVGDPDAGPPVGAPLVVEAELVASSPAGVATPPTWNAHLSKLVGDAHFLYAVHTYYPSEVASRLARIMRRPAATPGATWTEVARVSYPHQPPGVVMDTAERLHLVFECLRPGAADVECFPGGAGTGGLASRFYHLVFAARDAGGALRFDTYANVSEWTAETNGYDGIGTTPDGITWWSLADSSWQRVVQWWSSTTSFGTSSVLSQPPYYLLYPLHAAHPQLGAAELILYAGEFDPAGGANASYVASQAFAGSTAGLAPLIERVAPDPVAGQTNAFPSDVAYGPDGVRYLLSYRRSVAGQCTELIRYADLAAAPTIKEIGCRGNYATLHVASSRTLYVLDAGSGATVRLSRSDDDGTTWTAADVPLTGLPANGDVRWFGFTPVKSYTSPGIFDRDRVLFFFSGADASDLCRHSYLGSLRLE
jgi:hypothetical protein